VKPLIQALRSVSRLPLAVGFGISRPEHVAELGKMADGVVVGSAIMRLIEEHPSSPDLEERLECFIRSLREAL
jgi:tryptophan synthase alpha chain